VTETLEEQIRAFAARNVGGEAPCGDPEELPAYADLVHDRGRRGLLVLVAVLVVLVVAASVAISRIGSEGATTIEIEPVDPVVPADPLLTLATRAAAADTRFFTGSWPEHALALQTTVGALGEPVAGVGCDPATPVLLVEFRWDDPITRTMPERWPVPEGEPDPVPTDMVQYYRVGPLDGTGASATCGSGTMGLLQEPMDLAGLGPLADVAVGDQLVVVASSLAVSHSSLLENLPASAEAVTTTPDRVGEIGLGWSPQEPDCAPAEVMVVQLHYPNPPESYMGEGSDGPVHAAISSSASVVPVPLEAPMRSGCGGGGRMAPTPVDLSVLGTPVPIDLRS
jgi:hypothetical protein